MERYMLYGTDSDSIAQPLGNYDELEDAQEAATELARAAGIIEVPFKWRKTEGAWYSDVEPVKPSDLALRDAYIILDREHKYDMGVSNPTPKGGGFTLADGRS